MKKILIPIFAILVTSLSAFSQNKRHPEEDIPMAKVPVEIAPGPCEPTWKVWGEGNVVMPSGNLGPKQAATPYTAQDIRFTVNNGSLYAWLMAWPDDNKVVVNSLPLSSGK
jgi:hypothetical protein